jgi:hypothetical protein
MKVKRFFHMPERPNFTELGARIGESRQAVYAALNQDIDRCRVGTLRKYARAIGKKVELITK